MLALRPLVNASMTGAIALVSYCSAAIRMVSGTVAAELRAPSVAKKQTVRPHEHTFRARNGLLLRLRELCQQMLLGSEPQIGR